MYARHCEAQTNKQLTLADILIISRSCRKLLAIGLREEIGSLRQLLHILLSAAETVAIRTTALKPPEPT